MKILVTGANGYIGQGVVKELLNRGHYVVATDFDSECVDSRAEFMKADIFLLEEPYEFFGKPDILIHLAWRDGFKHNSDSHINDLPLHYAFIKRLIDGGLKKVSIMGSMHEIGYYEGCIDENTPCNPMSLYGIAKNSLRMAVQIYAEEKNVDFVWLRGYYIVGNSEYGCSIFSKITQAVKEGKTEFPFTTGKNQYDFISYEDFCKQVVLATLQDQVKGIVNCCSGYPEKLSKRTEQFIKEQGYSIKLLYGAYPERAYDSKAVWGNNTKIRDIMRKDKHE